MNPQEPIEAWRRVFRVGICPQLTDAALRALAAALESNDSRLVQGVTTMPPPIQCHDSLTGACPIGFCGWIGDGLCAPEEVDEFFSRIAREADCLVGEECAVRWFTGWVDNTPREEMRRELLPEVYRAIGERNP